MVVSENIKEFNRLVEEIFQDYIEKGDFEINVFKEELRAFVSNPLSSDKRLYKLITYIHNNKKIFEKFDFLWSQIEDLIYEKSLEDKIKKKLDQGKIKEFEDRLINFFVKAGQLKGQNVTFSTIIGCFLIHNSLTQDQVRELTGFSKGSVSTNLNALEEYGFLKKKLIKGTRKYLYSFGGDFSRLSANTGAFKKEVNEKAKKFFQSKIKELNEFKDKKGYKILSERLSDIMKFLEIHKKLIDHIMDSEFIKNIESGKL